MAEHKAVGRTLGVLFAAACMAWAAGTPYAQQAPAAPAQAPAAAPQQRMQAPPPQASALTRTLPLSAERRRGRRDPFRSLLVGSDQLTPQALPPGKRGLLIGQIRVDGIVLTPTTRLAVVTVPNRNRAFFLRERDELFNGYVAEIHEDSVVFKERAVDAFGKPYEREVVKQILSAAGATK